MESLLKVLFGAKKKENIRKETEERASVNDNNEQKLWNNKGLEFNKKLAILFILMKRKEHNENEWNGTLDNLLSH